MSKDNACLLGILYSKRRFTYKTLDKKFKNAKFGDVVINIVKRKNKQGLTNEHIYKIIKFDLNDWVYYEIKLPLYKELEYAEKKEQDNE